MLVNLTNTFLTKYPSSPPLLLQHYLIVFFVGEQHGQHTIHIRIKTQEICTDALISCDDYAICRYNVNQILGNRKIVFEQIHYCDKTRIAKQRKVYIC